MDASWQPPLRIPLRTSLERCQNWCSRLTTTLRFNSWRDLRDLGGHVIFDYALPGFVNESVREKF